MNQKYIDVVVAISFFILAVTLYMSTAHFGKASLFTTSTYIKFLAISLGIASIVQVVKVLFFEYNLTVYFTKDPKRFIALIVTLLVYVFLMEYLGFIIATLIFLPLSMRFMGYPYVIKSLIITFGITIFVYVLFVMFFEIQLPVATILPWEI
jgi:putative tricarboxylic transport membrane protein